MMKLLFIRVHSFLANIQGALSVILLHSSVPHAFVLRLMFDHPLLLSLSRRQMTQNLLSVLTVVRRTRRSSNEVILTEEIVSRLIITCRVCRVVFPTLTAVSVTDTLVVLSLLIMQAVKSLTSVSSRQVQLKLYQTSTS